MKPAANDKIFITEVTKIVNNYFKGNDEKTILWFKTKNPLLGGIAPIEMIKNGRSKKLLSFVESCVEGYYP
jgi:hypothetical protein